MVIARRLRGGLWRDKEVRLGGRKLRRGFMVEGNFKKDMGELRLEKMLLFRNSGSGSAAEARIGHNIQKLD